MGISGISSKESDLKATSKTQFLAATFVSGISAAEVVEWDQVSGMEWSMDTFQAPPSRTKAIVVGASSATSLPS